VSGPSILQAFLLVLASALNPIAVAKSHSELIKTILLRFCPKALHEPQQAGKRQPRLGLGEHPYRDTRADQAWAPTERALSWPVRDGGSARGHRNASNHSPDAVLVFSGSALTAISHLERT